MKSIRKSSGCGAVAAVLLVSFTPATRAAELVPASMFTTLDGLEVTVWAASPMLRNPTNIDIDKDGRIWVAEGVNYRGHYRRQPEGDRIMVLQDTDGDGSADKSHVFVQEPGLIAPLGVAVLDNKVVVSQPPDLIVYTDVNRNQVFESNVDKREILLTGFSGINHDHSLHSVTAGPDGLWYWNAGNMGALFTDRSGKTFRIAGPYQPKPIGAFQFPFDFADAAGKASDDGHVYVGGFAARMKPDGTRVEIIGHNFRNSYEQAVTSFGDVFQNDNDDPPACRVSFVLEYGNAGFSSADGKRTWQADRRPGQSVPVAEWRQEDPGTMPAGDVYGGGSPTGVAFYENGALGRGREGLLLTCEAGRNVVFGYHPKPDGAGYRLERFDFLTSNKEKQFAGSDFLGGGSSVTHELKTLFRPSDVAVGPDGAIYVSDWFDARVGGHQDLDETTSGAIYRVAPKGFKPRAPEADYGTIAGCVEALKSPAVNVRGAAAMALLEQAGRNPKPAMDALAKLLRDDNRFIAARAAWVLAQLGPAGVAKVTPWLKSRDENQRIVAYRALRRADHEVLKMAARMAGDPSPAVRREAALSMRNVPFAEAKDILLAVAKRFDGMDRAYLEAFGTGCAGKESQMYELARASMGAGDPVRWSPAMAGIAWRLHPPQSVPALKARALATSLPDKDRRAMLVALGFIPVKAASDAMLEIAAGTTGIVQTDAIWWLLNQSGRDWKDHGLAAALKERGIYDPDTVALASVTVPEPVKSQLPPVETILKLKGDAARGKLVATACQTCHRIGAVGVEFGPDLTQFARMQTPDVVLNAVINPSAEIAHGFDGHEIVTKDGVAIHGIVLSNGDPVIIQSAGGVTQTVPRKRIQTNRPLGRSLMLSADQVGLQAQDLADLLAYLRSL